PTNRYVATNLYGEHKFGMGNLMVWGMRVKEGDIYQPWYINMVQALHNRVVELPHASPENFIDLASQKIKYMGVTESGDLQFKRLIPVEGIDTTDPQRAQEQLDYLRRGLESNPAMGPMLLHFEDENGKKCDFLAHEGCTTKATFIIGDYTDEVKPEYLSWVREVRQIVDEFEAEYGDRVEFMTAGEPYFLAYMLLDLVNKWWLFTISIAIVILVLWFEFRSWRGATFPLLGVGATIVMTLGLMGYTEFKLTTMMVLTPMLLLAIGIGHSVQVTRRFLLEHGQSGDCMLASREAIRHTIIPATLSIVTDMVGFATLATVDISFYKDYAYFGVFGMLTLLLTTTTLIPLLLTVFPPTQESCKTMESHGWETTVGGFLTRLISGPGKWLPIGVAVLVFAGSAYYTNLMNWEGKPEDAIKLSQENDYMPGVEKGINYARAAFKGSSPTWKDLVQLNEIMPGVISVSIPIRGREPNTRGCIDTYFPDAIYDIEDRTQKVQMCNKYKEELGCWDTDACGAQGVFNSVELHTDLEKMENWMRAHEFIGYTGSYTQYVRLVNMLLTAEPGEPTKLSDLRVPNREYLLSLDPNDDRSPTEIVRMYNGLLEAMTSAGDMDSFVNTETWNEGVVLGFINTMDPVETHKVA
ncbi:MAG: MMPL family transporter, partial [Gammaproteobacteria bacterium]|nr:MMPL family transporter [Gammaproteobacteria bacterium]